MMNRTDAAAMLNIHPSASPEEARKAYQELYTEHQLRLTNAPTAALRSLYLNHLRELDEARDVLLGPSPGYVSPDLPTDQPSFPEKSAPALEPPPAVLPGAFSAGAKKPAVRRLWLRAILGGASVFIVVLAVLYFRMSSAGHLDVRNGNRLELALVARDPANQAGPPLHGYGDASKTYGIERDLTSPGDIEYVAAATDQNGSPMIEIHLAAAAVGRMNGGGGIVDREVALVLDGRTVLGAANVMAPLGSSIQMTGNFSLDDITRILDAIRSN